jgi:ketosteroid isomerase-like protein
MSDENVEVVRRSWGALERGGLDAAAEFWEPEIERGREYATADQAREAAGLRE